MDVNQIISDSADLLDPRNRNFTLGALQEATRRFLAAGDPLEEVLEDAGNIADANCEHTGTIETLKDLVRWAVGQGDAFTGWDEPTISRAADGLKETVELPEDMIADFVAELEQELILSYRALVSEHGLWSGRGK